MLSIVLRAILAKLSPGAQTAADGVKLRPVGGNLNYMHSIIFCARF